MHGKVLLEICLDSAESAAAAEVGGAHRVELCARLDVGGTTPAESVIQKVRESAAIGLYVMIRPRGGDFCYSEAEIASMKEDIEMAKRCGANGLVFGALRPDGSVDEPRVRDLVLLSRPLQVTFHRAFDEAADPLHALEDVIACGADRILTSGQQPTALEGASLLRDLVRMARGRIAIIPGAGIHRGNASDILERTGARELHVGAGVRGRPDGAVDPSMVRSLLASISRDLQT